jgi:hypothetical protein
MFNHTRTARLSAAARPARGRPRLTLELLEHRLSPATLTVNSTADTASDSDPYLSLREAIALVNSPTLPTDLSDQILGQISGTLHANGSDTILFDSSQVTTPIVLGGTQLELTLPGSTAQITIDGGSGVTLDAANQSRVLQVDSGVTATLDHLIISHGRTAGLDDGGGIDNAGTLTVNNSILTANTSGDYGGGIENDHGTMTVSNSTFSANYAHGGGGIENAGTMTVSNSTFSSNSAVGGGGIGNFSGQVTLTVSNCTLSSNSGYNEGGGIATAGTLTVSNSTLSANYASQGGGIFTDQGPVTVSNSTLTSNTAGNGGGIYNRLATMTLSNCTLSANSASSDGGGILNSSATLTVTNSTLSGNSASSFGGGIYDLGFRLSLENTIVAGNVGGDVVGSLFGTHRCLIGGNPLLSPLGYYGGPTQTMPPLAGSPALNTGDPAQAGTADQRGVVRSGSVNIGAFQASAAYLVVAAPDTVTAGVPFDVSVSAFDPDSQPAVGYTGTVTFSSADPYGATLPNDYPFTLADGGSHTFAGMTTLFTAGTWDVTATDGANGLTGSISVTVNAAAAVALRIDAPAVVTAGQPFDFAVSAVDPYGNVDPNYVGTFHLGILPEFPDLADGVFTPADHGQVRFVGIGLYQAGVQTIVAAGDLSGQADITVSPAAAVGFVLLAPSNAVSGTPFDVTIIALDGYGNTDSNYAGTIHFTTSDNDPGVVLPPDYTFQPSDAGMVTFSSGVTLLTAGDQTLTVTDLASGSTGSTVVTL